MIKFEKLPVGILSRIPDVKRLLFQIDITGVFDFKVKEDAFFKRRFGIGCENLTM